MAKTILVVEDDRLLKAAIAEELADAGYTVLTAETGKEAMMKLQNNAVDLMYLDIMLPGEWDGYEVLRQLKTSGVNQPQLRVIMLSNLGQIDEIDRAMELGAEDYVVKANVDLSRLVELTRKKLGV